MRKAPAFITITIPRFQNTVKTTQVVAPRMSAPVNNGLETLGKTMQSGADSIATAVGKEVAEQDASRVIKVSSEYDLAQNAKLYGGTGADGKPIPGLLQTTGEEALKGIDGKPLDTHYADWQRDASDQFLNGLGNERQKEMLKQHILKSNTVADGAIKRHTWQQSQIVKEANVKASTDSLTDLTINQISNDSDPEIVASTTEKLKTSIYSQAALKGLGPDSDYAKNLLSEKMSKVHSNVIMSFVGKDDDQRALDYYNENKDQITDPAERRVIDGNITKIETKVNAYAIADDMWLKYKPKDVNSALDMEGAREAMRKDYANESAPVQDMAEKRFEELSREYQQQKKSREEASAQRIHGMYVNEKKGYGEIVKAINLDPAIDNITKDNLLDWADRKFKITENKNKAEADAKRARELQQLVVYLQFQKDYTKGDVYGTLTPQQVAAKASELGPYADDATKFVDHVNNDPSKAKTTDAELMDTVRILRSNKQFQSLLPETEKPSDSEKAKMALLQQKVIEIKSRDIGKPGQGISTKAAVLEAIQSVTTDYGHLWNTKEPAYIIGSDLGKVKPAKMSKDAQNRIIAESFYRNPKNKGKVLDFKTIEKYRAELIKE